MTREILTDAIPLRNMGGVFAASPQNPTGGAAALAIKGRRRRPLWIFAASSSATDPLLPVGPWKSGRSGTIKLTGEQKRSFCKSSERIVMFHFDLTLSLKKFSTFSTDDFILNENSSSSDSK